MSRRTAWKSDEAAGRSPGPNAAHRRARTSRAAAITALSVALDVLSVLVGFGLTYAAYSTSVSRGWLDRGAPDVGAYGRVTLGVAALTVAVFAGLGLYQRRASVLNLSELRRTVQGVGLVAALLFALLFMLKLKTYSRLVLVGGIMLSLVLILLTRRVGTAFRGWLCRRGLWSRRVLIYGCGPAGKLLMKKIVHAPQLGWTVVGFVDDVAQIGTVVSCRTSQTGPLVFEAPVLGRCAQALEIVERHDVDELIVTTPTGPARLREQVQLHREGSVRVAIVPQLDELRWDQMSVEDVSAIPLLRFDPRVHRPVERFLKRAVDLTLGPVALLLTLPFWIVAAVWIRLDSPGPILFVQERVGQGGRRFRMFKFRTMWANASPYDHSPQNDATDGRVTRSGRFLRAAGLDELPQLLNVIRGDMSLVGPRPEMPFLVNRYGPLERQRLEAKPGVTGLWQLSADRHAEIHENLEYDLYYIAHQSLLLDLHILLETCIFTAAQLLRVFGPRGDRRPAQLPHEGRLFQQPYTVVALDQRRGRGTVARWRRCIDRVAPLAARRPVRFLVARRNVDEFDSLLASASEPARRHRDRMEYALNEKDHDVRETIGSAALVVTDIAHVADLARSLSTPVATISGDDQLVPDSPRAAELVQELGVRIDDTPHAPHARLADGAPPRPHDVPHRRRAGSGDADYADRAPA